jgi:membrane dipeptidase
MLKVNHDRANRIFNDALVWDNHLCLPMNPARNLASLPLIEDCHRNGVDVVSINIGFGSFSWDQHLQLLTQMRQWFLARSERFTLPATAQDILTARSDGKMSIIFDVEGAIAIGDDLTRIRLLHDLGVRWLLLAYNNGNKAGGGCHDDVDLGLTAHGRALIDEMERVGMLVCASHSGYRTAREILDYSRAPVIFSHSNARALRDHPRNIDDDMIRRCAATGGVIGINAVNIFLGEGDASGKTMAKHIDHIVQLVGIDHAALGLDWAPKDDMAEEIATLAHLFPSGFGYEKVQTGGAELLPDMIEQLLTFGYGDEDIKKVLGGNLLRLAQANWMKAT